MYKCSSGETVETYKEYLRTKHWLGIKKAMYNTFEYKCVKCGCRNNLHIHHLTYDRVGHELISDLVYLCSQCHLEVHEDYKLDKVINKKQIIKKQNKRKNNKFDYNKVKVKKKANYKKPKPSEQNKLTDLSKYKY